MSAGRGYPDLAFIGVDYQVVISDYLFTEYGTSCTAPVLAALGKWVTLTYVQSSHQLKYYRDRRYVWC
jgi:hypothetical protein